MAPHRTGCSCVQCRKKNLLQDNSEKEDFTITITRRDSLPDGIISLDQLPILSSKCSTDFPRKGHVRKIFIYTLDIDREEQPTIEQCVRDGFCEMQLDILHRDEADAKYSRQSVIICREKNIALWWSLKIDLNQKTKMSILESGSHRTMVR